MSALNRQLPTIAPRRPDSHKGDYGRVLLIGGSRGMAGAVSLSGMAVLRSGAGLVKLAVPEPVLDTVAGFDPCYMTVAVAADPLGRIAGSAMADLKPLIDEATVVAIGPGLGQSEELFELVVSLFSAVDKPMVVDADALNAIASKRDRLGKPAGPRVLTPHPGEFARLLGEERIAAEQRRARAKQLAADLHSVVLLKGHRTFITDGKTHAENTTGNPGMATGGMGDVLTGIITGLIAQGLNAFDAAHLGAYVHGYAGDEAADELGQISLTARDLIEHLPNAYKALEQQASASHC